MVKTEKYKDSVMRLTLFCKHINRNIGDYESHYLTQNCNFTVELTNGTLILPINLVADFNKENTLQTTELILKAAGSFKSKIKKQKSYKEIVSDWFSLFSDNGEVSL